MRYLHSMVRVHNLEESLDFFCNKLGLLEVRRHDHEAGRFTVVFLAAARDKDNASPPTIELTYNWPDKDGNVETYTGGRNFGHLAYAVENIYETCQQLLDKGVAINRPPRDGRMAFIKSPDGISIELLQDGEALPTTEPWASMKNTGSW